VSEKVVSESARIRNADPNAVAVIVGASRGIGLASTQALFRRFSGRIIALCRDPASSGALSALTQFDPNRLQVAQCDITDESSISKAVEFIGDRVDLLYNTAGLLHVDDYRPETSVSRVDADFLRMNFEVNSVGPILLAKHLGKLMMTKRKPGRVPSVFASITARVGSIEDNSLGGWISYRASKAAHNAALKTCSIEFGRRGTIVVALHPGTVNTDLSQPFQKNVPAGKLFPVDMAANQLLEVIDSLEQVDNGSFFDYARKPIPW